MALVGNPPEDLGLIDLDFDEMLFWMYCPIKVPGWQFCLPAQLRQFEPIVEEVKRDLIIRTTHAGEDLLGYMESIYVYLTAKTLWVDGKYVGNRPGWHTDGFGTDDINYIWSSRAPTEFFVTHEPVEISDDCDQSMQEMEKLFSLADWRSPDYAAETYRDKHLLRLDPTVMHRTPVFVQPGMRTFVKVSVSKDRYNLKGNAVNHDLPASHWPLVDRETSRNHPTKEA